MSKKQTVPTLYCTRCDDEAHENQVEGKSFYYCRTCKTEVYSPSLQKQKKDTVELANLTNFYVDTEGYSHCGHCTAKQGENHSSQCTRNTRSQLEFEFAQTPTYKVICDHTATYAYDSQTVFCLLCNKDLS